jgi:pyruvate,orthophosphate dikinase
MILAYSTEGRKKALAKILPYQRKDFTEIFRVMKGLPVTIRTLDPPLHEFLPHTENEITKLAELIGTNVDEIKYKLNALHEFNPMLGHRGCRLGISFPEITEMQSRAIFEAAAAVIKEGKKVYPEIMIPLIGNEKEFIEQETIIKRTAEEVMKEKKIRFKYKVGTMIEIPRAALVADKIAKYAEFFSFGTNDLTQMTFGISRDDAASFMPDYREKEILNRDPFESIDTEGVGMLMELAVNKGRKTRPDIKLGICGEHGGEPDSITFCDQLGLEYVSCSPFRVPVARLAAARASLNKAKK